MIGTVLIEAFHDVFVFPIHRRKHENSLLLQEFRPSDVYSSSGSHVSSYSLWYFVATSKIPVRRSTSKIQLQFSAGLELDENGRTGGRNEAIAETVR
ncbi:hypothetical protein MTO96_043143 [Rhipicephalus appendiculatus]